ncbi:MAG TPA: PQQ-dependent sugar dehydrogenase [Candidatus Thermoplasmatota archaeon]|nr:PQQ-dependent sugar dehydrogenase [Candidatus Thermoplasmatota archaeon]
MRAILASLVLGSALAAGCLGAPPSSPPGPPLDLPEPTAEVGDARLDKVLDGLDRPVQVVFPPDSSGRMFVVEQGGLVRVARGGALLPKPFLDLRDDVSGGGEQGLLSLAFDPDFAVTRRVFVDYTDPSGDTVLARYLADAEDPDRADTTTRRVVLEVDQPFSNHNGGLTIFGPDGHLYVGLGDGGSAGDPANRAQDREDVLGKMLRLDVRGETYSIPRDNPLLDDPDARPEIWALGLRNPWRYSFDRATGDLYIGDVGQNAVEEIDFQPRDSTGGENYGWNVWEGSRRFRPGATDGEPVFPVAEHGRDGGDCSITGGYVYRGARSPSLVGTYLYSDYCSGTLRGLAANDGAWTTRDLLDTGMRVSSFGEDQEGEVYVVDHGGGIYKVVAE